MKARTYKKKVSYIISVSLGKGCYRHIRISGKNTLDNLAGCILDAFDFYFDHLYSFFMDNKWWSEIDEYCSPYAENPPYADKVKLAQLRLEKGQQFKFLFDYGDEWRFQCKVLQVLDEETTEPVVVCKKGAAPEQYPDYDDEYDEDDSDSELIDIFNGKVIKPYDNPQITQTINPLIEPECSEKNHEIDFKFPEPEIPDALMEAAFQFRSDKLWKKIYDSENFAVKLSDGKIGYCCIMGNLDDCIALALYIGDKGLRSLEIVKNSNVMDNPFTMLISQNCLQIGLDNKSDIPEEAVSPVQKYAKEHEIQLRGKKTYPNFLKFQSYYTPCLITEENDFQYLLEALNAAHAVSEKLKNSNKTELFIDNSVPTIPLLTPDNSGYKWSFMKLPEIKPAVFPTPALKDDSLLNQIKKLKKHGTWECRHYIVNQPDIDEEKQKLVFPSLIVFADIETNQCRHIKRSSYYPDSAEALIKEFAEILLDYGSCPETILTSGERSLAFFRDFCDNFDIQLKETDKFTMLEDKLAEIMNDSVDYFEEMQMTSMLELLGSLSKNKLEEMPEELFSMLNEIAGTGILPDSLEKKLKEIKK